MYKLLLCLRYLKTRYIALACIISVTLGVATMIVVNSVMAGFSAEMKDRIKGILSDIVLEAHAMEGQPDAEKHLALVQEAAGEYIAGMTATVEVYGMLSFQFAGEWITRPVTLIGIKPAGKATVGPLAKYLKHHEGIPDWSLPEEAAEYRREMAQRRRMFDRFDAPGGMNGDEGHDAPARPDDLFPPEAADPAAGDNIAQDDIAQGKGNLEPVPDPFKNAAPPMDPGVLANADPPEQVEPGAPLDGRLYLGIGLVSYQLEDEDGEIQTEMYIRPGDDVKISTVSAGRPPEPRYFNATVVDIFKSGMSEYDSNLVFCNLEKLQEVRGMVTKIGPDEEIRAITSVQIKLKDYRDADEVVRRLRSVFPPGLYSVRTWEQKQGPLLAAVEIETAILNVLLFLIIAVAGFGILAIFFMIVVEKTRDIGILKALGTSSKGVMSIFLSYGLALGIVGSGAGVIGGLLFVKYINHIEAFISTLTGRPVFDERIYYFPEIPTDIQPFTVIWVALGAMAIAVLASVLPARRASRLHPVEALRYE